MSGLAGSCERNNGNLSLLIILREHSNKMSKSSKSFSSSRRTPRRGQQYRPMGSIHESFDNLSMHDSANRAGIDSFLAGTPTKSKRLSQTPKRTGTPRSCLNNPFPRESSHCSYKRDASFSTSNSRTTSTPNRSSDEKPTDTTAKHPIRIVISGVDLSEEDEEVSRLVIPCVSLYVCLCGVKFDEFSISHSHLYLFRKLRMNLREKLFVLTNLTLIWIG